MDFKEKLTTISDDLNHNKITEQEARKRICVLLGVVGRSEQLKCDYCDEPLGEEHEKDKYACTECRNSW